MATATREGTVEAFLIEGGSAALGHRPPGRQQERRPADPRRVPAHRRPGHARERPAHPRRRGDDRADRRRSASRSSGRARTRVRVWAADVTSTRLDPELCTRIRASILLAGPLLARFGAADVPPPGGDVIGRRRVDTHLMAFAALGADVRGRPRVPAARPRRPATAPRSTSTRPVGHRHRERVMAAALARGTTVIMNAACEPHVQDLCHLLVRDGRPASRASARTC